MSDLSKKSEEISEVPIRYRHLQHRTKRMRINEAKELEGRSELREFLRGEEGAGQELELERQSD